MKNEAKFCQLTIGKSSQPKTNCKGGFWSGVIADRSDAQGDLSISILQRIFTRIKIDVFSVNHPYKIAVSQKRIVKVDKLKMALAITCDGY